MKVIFYTFQKTAKSKGKEKSIGRTGFGMAVGAILGSDKPKKGNRILSDAPAIQAVHKPKMKESEVQEANEEQYNKIVNRYASVLDVMDELKKNDRAVKQLKNMISHLKTTIEIYQSAFRTQHGQDPASVDDPAQDDDALSNHYISFVINKKNPNPSQNQLAAYSKISQTTWSREFKKIKFWEGVEFRTKIVWDAHGIVQKNIEELKNVKVIQNEIREDKETMEAYPEPNADSFMYDPDYEKYLAWGKDKLMEKILAIVPSLRKAELDRKPAEKLALIYLAYT